ncbi:MAG: 3-hydroxyacyl-CoA dehydrogenase NAD-binding domain-containing protein [Porticoccaceae bacterium]|nr:3-hydroxyacyl-CoA dehydrogenase NAD-binding domain-containing protein [Porticoccaceae bacterium]
MSVFKYEKDTDGIVTVTMDMTGSVNAMNKEYEQAMEDTLAKLESEEGLAGVVIASAKKVFFAGADLNVLLATREEDKPWFMQWLTEMKSQLRRLEKLPVPVVAAINGAALGGGFELALACNYRIAYDHKSVQLGLPEVTLGLLPGGGGIVRMVNLLGLETALPFLLDGKKIAPAAALNQGIIDATVARLDELIPTAKAYILAHVKNPQAALQPWDRDGFSIPGGSASSPNLAQLLAMAPVMVQQKTRGLLPAPEEILNCAVEAARLDFETALRIESRGLTYLVATPEAKNMMTTFFFQMTKVNSGLSRPKGIAVNTVKKVGILGAGMMGQGIANVCAMAGISVVIKAQSLASAEKAKAYTEALLAKRVAQGRMQDADKTTIVDLITPTTRLEDFQGCDLIIETVYEDMDTKKNLTAAAESYLGEGGIWATNTSTLPIAKLAEASARPENFIGIHFFSPADKMPLIEIICGAKTSDETLAKAFDFAKQLKKTPIVVNDSLGFFSSRTFITYLDEGIRLLAEGVHPVKIDNLGKQLGMPLGPLAIHDEISLELNKKVLDSWNDMGLVDIWGERDTMRQILDTLVNQYQRCGKYKDGGFYDYKEGGGKEVWPQLLALYYKQETAINDQDIKDRLLFRPVIESLKCLQSGVLRTAAEGNIGSIMGIGAPTHTGGFIQFVNTYGLAKFIERCEQLSTAFGERFQAPAIVADKLNANEWIL